MKSSRGLPQPSSICLCSLIAIASCIIAAAAFCGAYFGTSTNAVAQMQHMMMGISSTTAVASLRPSEPPGLEAISISSTTATSQGHPSEPSEWKAINVFVGPQETFGRSGLQHSQVGQDWLIATLLDCKRDGFFVDLAANHAVTLSNSLMLERDFGWNGICVEANLDYMYGLAHRRCKVVAGAVGSPKNTPVAFLLASTAGGIIGKQFDNKGARGGKVVNLRTVPLADILTEMGAPSVIDYFSLDVEGAESVVMQDFPWDKYRFLVITVERPKDDLVQQLLAHGYHRLRINSVFRDETWIPTTFPNFEKIMHSWSNAMSRPNASVASCMIAKGYKRPGLAHREYTGP